MQTTAQAGRTAENLADKANTGINRLSETAHQAVDRMASAASSTAEQLNEKSEEWMALKDRALHSTRGYVKEHPLASAGVALAVGLILGFLARRQ